MGAPRLTAQALQSVSEGNRLHDEVQHWQPGLSGAPGQPEVCVCSQVRLLDSFPQPGDPEVNY